MAPLPDQPREPDPIRAGASRLRILRVLRDTDGRLGVTELAEAVGLHANTVRFHLDRLVAEELVDRQVEDRTDPGRPRLTFAATTVPDPIRTQRRYRLLAEMLAGLITEAVANASLAANHAGERWGRYLTERLPPSRAVGEEEAIARLVALLDEIGFLPELGPAPELGGLPEIWLRHCPFLEVAEAHREVVCAIHLGLMRGALAEMRAPLTADRLRPFVEPNLCVAHLVDATPAGSDH